MKTACSESRDCRAATSTAQEKARWRSRTEALLHREIGFIPNRVFASRSVGREILSDKHAIMTTEPVASPRTSIRDMPAHLLRLCETPLLTAAEERDLFRRMNYLKFRANQLRARLNPSRPNKRRVEQAEMLLAQADEAMHRLVTANIRLVISIIRQLGAAGNDFDELLSDGITSLINAVEKFDFDRGFRFSTYATMVVKRHLYRCLRRLHRDRTRFPTGEAALLMECPQHHGGQRLDETQWRSLTNALDVMFAQLDSREQKIIRERFGFDANGRKRSLQSIAHDFGVCKERVRQLEQRAMAKLKEWAPKFNLQELLDRDSDDEHEQSLENFSRHTSGHEQET